MSIKEYFRRRKEAREMLQAIYGIALNSTAVLYDCHRVNGESNRRFKKRLFLAAMKSDMVFTFVEGNGNVELHEMNK